MARSKGSALYVSFAAVVISGAQRSGDWEQSADLVDDSAGSDANKTYLAFQKDGKFSIEYLYEVNETAWDACAEGASGTLIVGPNGNAASAISETATALVARRRRRHAFRDVVVVTVDFQISGAVTAGTFPA